MTELMSESIGENQKFLICQIYVSEILSGSHIFATDLWLIFKKFGEKINVIWLTSHYSK